MHIHQDTPVQQADIQAAIQESWNLIAPFWPLKNLIAVNPLSGLEDLPFEEALRQGQAYFQQKELPEPMYAINRESIKWLQAYFDEGQSTISMPFRGEGLLPAMRRLLPHDSAVCRKNSPEADWLKALPVDPEAIIEQCLQELEIPENKWTAFLQVLLTTLPGWAAHVQYRNQWADASDRRKPYQVSKTEYLAFRIILTRILWPQAYRLLRWQDKALKNASAEPALQWISKAEQQFRSTLLAQFAKPRKLNTRTPDAQLIFCIDVRSEPFRRALEQQGNYDTLGFAGFFGVPVAIANSITNTEYASCPVLLQPAHTVEEQPSGDYHSCQQNHQRQRSAKQLYQSLKYTFTTPFALVETLGAFSGLGIALRNLLPKTYQGLMTKLAPDQDFNPDHHHIPLQQQAAYAGGALRAMGLTANFAPLVILCGHGSQTQNNAYATALDCGACGGHHGAPNAKIMANILNTHAVREILAGEGIRIPDSTWFLAAEHNTTTDELRLFDQQAPKAHGAGIRQLKADLEKARVVNNQVRVAKLGGSAIEQPSLRAADWAQVRPEWGLAGNAAFIVAPRNLTREIDLDGRSFLHSYDWTQDAEGKALTTILTAPMVVGQWINSQYLFSTIDNIAYGGGSKITKNISGKIGIMQGNASDLMTGLPLQSVYSSDGEAYHQPVRLLTVVYAPADRISAIVAQQEVLQKLFGNGWVSLVCLDPISGETLQLSRELEWMPANAATVQSAQALMA